MMTFTVANWQEQEYRSEKFHPPCKVAGRSQYTDFSRSMCM